MKTNFLKSAVSLVVLFAAGPCYPQGFVNLDFEAANLSAYGGGPAFVPAASAIPGWTAYVSGIPQAGVIYNAVPLGDASVTLQGTNSGYPPISGQYFVWLFGQYNPSPPNPGSTNSAAIGQRGQVPLSTKSLVFWGNIGSMQVSFNGQNLNYTAVGSGPNWTIYGADISAFAGQVGQLLFTAPYNGGGSLDNIQFSALPIPEPRVTFMLGMGALLLGLRLARQPEQVPIPARGQLWLKGSTPRDTDGG